MNRNRLLVIITGIFAVVLGYLIISNIQNSNNNEHFKEESLWSNYKVETRTIEEKEFRLIVAENPEQWEKGLMFVRKPVKDFDGMIFKFPSYEPRTFWNMNTFENLTLYWMKDETIVGKSNLPSIEVSNEIVRVSSPSDVNIVVEIIN